MSLLPGTALFVPPKPKKKRAPQRTKQTLARMEEVASMLQTLVPQHMIEKNLGAKWGKKRRYVRSIVHFVFEDWRDMFSDPEFQNKRRDQLRLNWQTLYMKAMSQSDFKTCAYALRELGQLDGLYAPKDFRVGVGVQGVTSVGLGLATLGFTSSEQVQERIDELQNLVTSAGPAALAKRPPGTTNGSGAQQIIDINEDEAASGGNGEADVLEVQDDS